MEQLGHEESTLCVDITGGNNPTRQSLSQIARLHTWLHRLILHGAVVIANAVYRLVASFAESKGKKNIKQCWGHWVSTMLTVRYSWYEGEDDKKSPTNAPDFIPPSASAPHERSCDVKECDLFESTAKNT